jgi:uncharacterized protein YjiS (DUF1127 family)
VLCPISFEEQIMFDTFRQRLRSWRLCNAARRQLAMLDDHILADIGTSRSAIGDFVAHKSQEKSVK